MIDLLPYWLWALMLVVGVLVVVFSGFRAVDLDHADEGAWRTSGKQGVRQ